MAKPRTMARAPRWRRRKDDRPGAILAAALACFAERGFAATRLDDVAKRAGVTKGTLYLYFPNKEELFKAVVRQAIVPNIARGETLLDETAEPSPVALARLIANWSEVMTTPASAVPKIVVAESGNFPDIARFYLEEVVERGLGLFTRLLSAGVERGEFGAMDIDNTALCVVAPLILGMLWRHSFERHGGRPLDPDALCRAHLRLLSHGLGPVEPERATPSAGPAKHLRRQRKGAGA
jgi:AcrR family transcriptional regulator